MAAAEGRSSPPQQGKARTLYNIERTCGRGKFSTVYRATRKSDGAMCALKRIKLAGIKELSVREKCLKESQLLQSLDHPNIIQYYDSFFENESELVIALEWATVFIPSASSPPRGRSCRDPWSDRGTPGCRGPVDSSRRVTR